MEGVDEVEDGRRRRFRRYFPFFVGVAAHTVAWLIVLGPRMSEGLPRCSEASCYMLVGIDFPASLAFVAGEAYAVTYGSLVLGALLWGVVARWLVNRFASDAGYGQHG